MTAPQPIQLIRAGNATTDALCAEILRCEGFPWLAEWPVDGVASLPAETALVVVSSVLGASLLVGAARLEGMPAVLLFAVLLIVGISVQLGSGAARPPRRRRSAPDPE